MSVTFKTSEPFYHNFDLSVVIPFYRKMGGRSGLPKNRKYVERNGIEVVIVLDTPEESQELQDFILQYPFMNCRIVIDVIEHNIQLGKIKRI